MHFVNNGCGITHPPAFILTLQPFLIASQAFSEKIRKGNCKNCPYSLILQDAIEVL